jgi:putative hydrolase of the HAD superfamily
LFDALWAEFELARAWHVFPDVVPSLERIQKAGVRLAVVSNWDSRLEPTLQNLGLRGFFEVILASVEIGEPKPSPRVFAEAAARLRLPASAILHVGDSAGEDLEGARGGGFQAVLIARGAEQPSGSIRSLWELAEAVTVPP